MNTTTKFIPLDEVDYMDRTKPLDLVKDKIIRDIFQHETTLKISPLSFQVSLSPFLRG